MLVHKVFRRYTIRAKAGGGQASHDNKVDSCTSRNYFIKGSYSVAEAVYPYIHSN